MEVIVNDNTYSLTSEPNVNDSSIMFMFLANEQIIFNIVNDFNSAIASKKTIVVLDDDKNTKNYSHFTKVQNVTMNYNNTPGQYGYGEVNLTITLECDTVQDVIQQMKEKYDQQIDDMSLAIADYMFGSSEEGTE